VASFTEKLINDMEVGNLYKHKMRDLVVKCTKSNKLVNDTFCGYVVKGDDLTPKGDIKGDWLCFMFDPYIESPTSTQVGGDHYKIYKIQPTEFIHTNSIPFIEGNIIKYVMRHKNKNGIEDLKKARHYIDLLIKLEYETSKVI
jgi:hypothetical protein